MDSSQTTTSKPFDLTTIGPFTEEEMTAMAKALLSKIDVEFKSSDPAPKRPLIEHWGRPKSYKTSVTVEADKFFRRNKFKTFCDPESAEHYDIRAETGDNPIIFQAKHLNVVIDQHLCFGKNRDGHLGQVSRNLPDMLYWYEKGSRKGIYSEHHANSAKEWIYEILRQDLIDVSIFFTCSVEAALKREFGQSVTQKPGSNMNEKSIAEALDIYEKVIRELKINVPNLPLFRIDTSEMTVKQATEEALRYILPTLCIRYQVPNYTFMPYALSLVQKVAKHSAHFEEQLKLCGYPSMEKILKANWKLVRESTQIDTYLNTKPNTPIDPREEVLRIREEGDIYKYMYKGESRDNLLSHRLPLTLAMEQNEAKKIIDSHQIISVLNKRRIHFRKNNTTGNGHFFTLHVDSVSELGDFTEIRARGSVDTTHTAEMLKLAEELGFRTSDIVEGNYLSLALKQNQKTP